jgi:16S rRNA (uracil1498-N3)-methyltransferase
VNLFYQPQVKQGSLHLDAEESHHAVRVLRLTEGSNIRLTDGKGSFYSASITNANPKQCEFEITEEQSIPKRNFNIHIAIAPTKNSDRTEWFVEKAIEIGVDKITFLLCQNSERKKINLERIQKIAIGAMKQSQQAWLPEIMDMKKFTEAIKESAEQKFIGVVDIENPLHLKQLAAPEKNYFILIGPEGDFRPDEVDIALKTGFKKISLGPNRLRTETAGLVAIDILNLTNY